MSDYRFKIGMYLPELQMPFEESLDTARDIGVDYIWYNDRSYAKSFMEMSDAEVEAVADRVKERGQQLFLLSPGGCLKQVHLAELELEGMEQHPEFRAEMDSLVRSMEVAAHLGVAAVNTFTFAWPGEYSAGKPTWPMRWQTRGGIIADVDMEKLFKAFSLMVEHAERYQVDIALGMMPWNYTNTTGNFRRVVERVGSRRLKVMWGPADNTNCGEWDVATAGFHNVRPYLYGLHLKDLRVNEGIKLDFDYCPIGEGDVDYLTVLRQLRDHDCDVILSLSTHYRLPGGTAEDAMRTNHANLTALIKQVEEEGVST